MLFKTFSLVATFLLIFTAAASEDHGDINLDLTLSVGHSSDDQGASSSGGDLIGKPPGYYRFVFPKFKITDKRIQSLEQCTAKLYQRGPGNHVWNFVGATTQLCYDMWARLEIEDIPQTEEETYPHCDSKQIPFLRAVASGGHKYKLKYEFPIGTEPYSDYYIDVMRCECQNKYSEDLTVMQSRRSFFIHQLEDSQYMILAPVDRYHRMKLKIVDFQDFNPPPDNEPEDEESPLMFTFL